MAERDRLHLFVQGRLAAERYRRPSRDVRSRQPPVPQDRAGHASGLRAGLELAARQPIEAVAIEGTIPGIRVVFESFPGIELAFERLESRRGRRHPELLSVREVIVDNQVVQQATVFIPEGQVGYFFTRIDQYLASVDADRPRHFELIDRVREIRRATLEQLWTDPPDTFPTGAAAAWWEVWLRRRDGNEVARLRSYAEQVGLTLGRQELVFPERIVVHVEATPEQLGRALNALDDLAELRRPRIPAQELALQPAADQADWVEQLAQRIERAPETAPVACIIDTGIHQPHPLIVASLRTEDCHACDPNWDTADHDGHGTMMAGLALFGDVGSAVVGAGPVRLRHGLESVKFLPPHGANPPALYGAITATAISLPEIQAPERRRVFSIATTTDDPVAATQGQIVVGQPSSWSSTVDALAAGLSVDVSSDGVVTMGREEGAHRLVLVSAGNVGHWEDDHLTRSDLEPIEDPGQAWNALTIGAYTDLSILDADEQGYEGWTPLSEHGELSPFSRTSVAFGRTWPSKPDVLFEGGNVARSPAGTNFDTPYAFQSLTTKAPLHDARLLTVVNATSAATAEAAHFAATLMAEYPSIWPETVRALMVHSAEWTPPMRTHFNAARGRQARVALRRRYGMGVPSLTRALRSATDALTLIVEATNHPFDGEGRMREMHVHDLPWPTEVLSELSETRVKLRVTLSYFIEPNPSRRGWVRRYSYASHGLRFEVRRPTESMGDFRKRLNELALAEEERRPTSRSDSQQWFFGPEQRSSGSIHSDIWHGTAADLASRGAVAVFPIAGWWKERPSLDRSADGVRYALVLSIETPPDAADIWTPVANEIGIPIEVAAL